MTSGAIRFASRGQVSARLPRHRRSRHEPWTRRALARLVCAITVLLAAAPASSTTVVPLTFADMVSRADAIFVGETVAVRSDWQTSRQGRHIVTTVTFRVDRTLKGQVGPQVQLEFLGGEIAGLVMEVDGLPRFRVGDRDVLFVSPNRRGVSPLVGFFNGRFRLTADRVGGTARVLTHDGQPFSGAQTRVGPSRPVPRSADAAMAYSEFESLVLQTMAQGVRERR